MKIGNKTEKGDSRLELVLFIIMAAALVAGFGVMNFKHKSGGTPAQFTPGIAKTSAASKISDSGPQEPIARALYLRGKMMQSPRETAEMLALLSDERLIDSARGQWVKGQNVSQGTGFLRRALEWKQNPKREAVLSAVARIVTLRSVSTVEQQARQTELLVLLIHTAPE
jgi:hypothetical protein